MSNKNVGFQALVVLLAFTIVPLVCADHDGVRSLRGTVEIDQPNKAAELKKWQHDTGPIERNYVQQPPLIPHHIKGYKINLRSNKCLTCHSWKNYKESGATKISLTHFKDRDGAELSKVAPRRYFCNQCHVPQTNARPLVKNTFTPIDAVDVE